MWITISGGKGVTCVPLSSLLFSDDGDKADFRSFISLTLSSSRDNLSRVSFCVVSRWRILSVILALYQMFLERDAPVGTNVNENHEIKIA